MSEESNNQQRFCTNCGSEVRKGAGFCASCGTNWNTANENRPFTVANPLQGERRLGNVVRLLNNTPTIWYVVAGIFALLVLFFLFSYSFWLGILVVLVVAVATIVGLNLRKQRGSQTEIEHRIFHSAGQAKELARRAYEEANSQYSRWQDEQAAQRQQTETLRRLEQERKPRWDKMSETEDDEDGEESNVTPYQHQSQQQESRSRQRETVSADGTETSLTTTEALNLATEYILGWAGSNKFTVASRTENSVTFSNYRPPSLYVAILLLIPAIIYLLIVPPILFDYLGSGYNVSNEDFNLIILLLLCGPTLIYFMVGGKHVYSTLTATPLSEGCRLMIGGESKLGYGGLLGWLGTLPDPSPSTTRAKKPKKVNRQAHEPEKPDSSRKAAPNSVIPEQIRKLAELRDAGILSDEEFEDKKTQLLDRM